MKSKKLLVIMLVLFSLNSRADNKVNLSVDIEPTTIMAIAQVAWKIYNYSSSSENQNEIINVELLKALNEKLSIINSKLDAIYTEIYKIPEKVEHVSRLSQAQTEISIYYEKVRVLNDYLKDYGSKSGKKKFLRASKKENKDKVEELKTIFFSLSKNKDPLTGSMLNMLFMVELDYLNWAGEPKQTINNRVRSYHEYFLELYTSLEEQMASTRSERHRLLTTPTYIVQHSIQMRVVKLVPKISNRNKNGSREGDWKIYTDLKAIGYLQNPEDSKLTSNGINVEKVKDWKDPNESRYKRWKKAFKSSLLSRPLVIEDYRSDKIEKSYKKWKGQLNEMLGKKLEQTQSQLIIQCSTMEATISALKFTTNYLQKNG